MIPKEYADNTCKFGKMAECCRYLAVDLKGFCCLKNTNLKKYLDDRAEKKEMHARADNCEGWKNESL